MRNDFIFSVLSSVLIACGPSAPTVPTTASVSAPAQRNNVVVIVVDDLGVDLISAYETHFRSLGRAPGSPASTPAIDRLLAQRGVLFTNAWSCPVCSPSRAQMLTGRHGFRTGLGANIKDREPEPTSNPGLSLDETLAPQRMREVGGYTSAAVGKWHIADMAQVALDPRHPLGSPAGKWFDRYAGSLFNLSRPEGNDAPPSYFNWRKLYASELVPGVAPCGDKPPPCEVAMTGASTANYATVDTANDALAVLGALPEPWFLWVAFNASHAPLGDEIPKDLPRASCADYAPTSNSSEHGTPPLDKRRITEALDTQIARLLCALDFSDTTVILVGDNGTDQEALLPPFNLEHSKGSLYEGGVNVPFIVRSPLIDAARAGSVSVALVSTVDLFATLAELAAGASGASRAQDSVSLVPLLTGRADAVRETLYSESFTPNFQADPITHAAPANYLCVRHFQALRDARFKLIRRWKREHRDPTRFLHEDEFYDLLHGGPDGTPDPYEHHDLLASEMPVGSEAQRALARLSDELTQRYPTLVR